MDRAGQRRRAARRPPSSGRSAPPPSATPRRAARCRRRAAAVRGRCRRRPTRLAARRAPRAGPPSPPGRSSGSAPAVCRTCAGPASALTSSAPACSAISDTLWASTSCISRAMRARSPSTACSARSSCCASACAARSRSDARRSRRAPMYEPAAVSSAASMSPDTRNPTQLDELWIAGDHGERRRRDQGHQHEDAVAAPDRQREQPDGQGDRHRRDGEHDDADGGDGDRVRPAPPQRRGAGQPDDQHQPPDQRSLVPADERLGERRDRGDDDEHDVADPRPVAGPGPSAAFADLVVTIVSLGTARSAVAPPKVDDRAPDHRLSSGVLSARRPMRTGRRPAHGGPMIHVEHLVKRYGRHDRRRRRLLHVPTRHHHRLPRPERRRQVHHPADDDRAHPAVGRPGDHRRHPVRVAPEPGPRHRRDARRRRPSTPAAPASRPCG